MTGYWSQDSQLHLYIQVDKVEDSFDIINSGAKPLSAYLFTNNKKLKEQFVMSVSAGGLVVNDTAVHVRNFLIHYFR